MFYIKGINCRKNVRAFSILFQIVIFPVHGCRCPLHISQFAGHFLFQHREKRESTEHHIDKKSRYSSVTMIFENSYCGVVFFSFYTEVF